MRKKIIGVALAIAVLAIFSAQSVFAQINAEIDVWTDKAQYKPGEKGTLKISMLNYGETFWVKNITIEYPWLAYDAQNSEWVGNTTIILEPAAEVSSNGGDYYNGVEFTIPTDGRAIWGEEVTIHIWTSEGMVTRTPDLSIAATSWPMSLAGLDTWMTYLIVALVVCTIILAVVLAATRGARASTPRVGSSRAKVE